MFIIKPITDKALQQKYCELCNITYIPHAMAYEAKLNGDFGGICQFELKKESGVLHNLCAAPGIEDFEMMFIMGRATMNFIDICELHTCVAYASTADHRLLTAIGFKTRQDGTYFVDMHGMFDGKCGNH